MSSFTKPRAIYAEANHLTNGQPFTTEPHFSFAHGSHLHSHAPVEFEKAFNYLSYQIRLAPNALVQHVRRIFLCLQCHDTTRLPIALIDLFLVLQQHGSGLKNRLLTLCRPHLNSTHENLLQRLMLNPVGLREKDIPDDCLLKYQRNYQHTYQHTSAAQEAPPSPARETTGTSVEALVQTFIENCQLDEAVELLEHHLASDPDNPGLQQQLIEIFRARGETERIDRFFNDLLNIDRQ